MLQCNCHLVPNLYLNIKYEIGFFWKMSNTAICYISVALSIKFNSDKGPRDIANSKNCNLQWIWTELWSENCFVRQPFTRYVERNLRNQVKQCFFLESLTGESFCTIAKFLFLERRLDARLYLCLCSVLRFS